MRKFFPATLEGLALAIAFKKLHLQFEIFLKGEPDDKVKKFKQFEKIKRYAGSAHEEPLKVSTLVLQMVNRGVNFDKEDAELFACAIFDSTNGLTDEKTTIQDVKALAHCFEHGGTLSKISVKLSFSRIFKMAREIMTKPVKCVHKSLKVSDVKLMIERTGFSGFPVVDDENRVIAVVAKKDVDRALKAGVNDLQLVMSIPPVTVHEKESLDKIGELMATYDVGRIIVVNDKMKAVGVVTRRDLVRAVASFEEKAGIVVSLSSEMKKLNARLLNILKLMGKVAKKRGEKVYAVGGFVRDLLRGKESLDVDVVVEGNGTKFAQEFALKVNATLRSHKEFNTATLIFDGISVDVATARSEYYENPGSLPKVESANLRKDLYRRDFTINAMAISLNDDFGMLFDFFGGRRDLHDKKIRVLHSMSFVEDPTRILRALRYAARFKFTLVDKTKLLLKDALQKKYLNSVSASRIRRELEKSLQLENADEVFEAFQLYSVFDFLPCRREVNFRRYFEFANKIERKFHMFYSVMLLLLKPCKVEIVQNIFKEYGVPKKFLGVFNRIYDPKFLENLKLPLSNSDLFFLLSTVEDEALPVLAYEDENIREKVAYFDRHLREQKLTKVNGEMLKERGIKGVGIGKMMRKILKLKLDAKMDEIEALNILMKGDKS